LELYRDAMVAFDQLTPLGDLTIRWTGSDSGDVRVTDEFDQERAIDAAVVVAEEEPVLAEVEEQS
jgi:segregation and condensation protein A